MAFKASEKAIEEIRQTLLLMDWIEAVGRNPKDLKNYSDKAYRSALLWARRKRAREEAIKVAVELLNA